MFKDKKRVRDILIAVGVIALLIIFDQISKYLVSHNERLVDGERIVVIKNIIAFELAFNKGAAWSILTGKKILLCSISLLASLLCLFFTIMVANWKNRKLLTSALILVTSGAMGNLIDRFFFKDGVVDFLSFEFMDYPTFNVADSLLTIGAVCLFVYVIFFFKDEDFAFLKGKKKNQEEGEKKDA